MPSRRPNKTEARRMRQKVERQQLEQLSGKPLVKLHGRIQEREPDLDPREIVDAYLGAHDGAEAQVPCEVCGQLGRVHPEDRYALLKGARDVPVTEMDADAAQEGKHQVRICASCVEGDPEVREVLTNIDRDSTDSITPDVMDRVHKKLVGTDDPDQVEITGIYPWLEQREQRLSGELAELKVKQEKAKAKADELAVNIQLDLRRLVRRGQLRAMDIERPMLRRTLAILAAVRKHYGDITARPDLLSIFDAIAAESDYCEACDRLYPKGTHQHDMATQHMNGSRQCDAPQLVTLVRLANFAAFEKAIPYTTLRALDPDGIHLMHYRSHGSLARGVPCRAYFRCEVYMKMRGTRKPVRIMLDVVPAWFMRLDEVPEARQHHRSSETVQVPFDELEDAVRVSAEMKDGIESAFHTVGRVSHTSTGVTSEWDLPEGIATKFELDEYDERIGKALAHLAKERGLEDYRALGEYEAFEWLANNDNESLVKDRFSVVLAVALQITDRQFTLQDVKDFLNEHVAQY